MVLLDFKYQKCINCKLLAVIYILISNEYFMCNTGAKQRMDQSPFMVYFSG